MRRYVALTLLTVGVVACGGSDDAASVVGGSSGAAGSTVVIDAGRGGGGSTGNGDASTNTPDASVTPPVDASNGSDQATTPDAGVDVSADVGVDAANERAADAPSEVAVDVATDAVNDANQSDAADAAALNCSANGYCPYCVSSAPALTAPPSCASGGPGAGLNCGVTADGGTGNNDCCASLLVPCGNFSRDTASPIDSNTTLHPATISAFMLDRYEVTVGRFRAFVNAGMGTQAKPPALDSGAKPQLAGSGWAEPWTASLPANTAALIADLKYYSGGVNTWTDSPGANENLPINSVRWLEAFAFCAWDGGRLPTDAELDYAESGGSEQRWFPWSQPPSSQTVDPTYASYGSLTSPSVVGATSPKGDGRWGQADLGGNIRELGVGYAAIAYPFCNDCAELVPVPGGSSRGGSFSEGSTNLAAYGSGGNAGNGLGYWIGFRCARDVPRPWQPAPVDAGSGDAAACVSTASVPGLVYYSRAGIPDGKIYARANDGSPDKFITNGEWPRVSPNGRYMAFKRNSLNYGTTPYYFDSDTYIRDLSTGVEKEVLEGFGGGADTINYTWTPDSLKLVYDAGGGQISTMNPDGTAQTIKYQTNGDGIQAPTVNPVDGRFVVHTFHSGLGMVDANGTNAHYIANTGAGDLWPVWTPDGQWIVFIHIDGPNFFQNGAENGNYFKIHGDGSNRTALTAFDHAGALGGFRPGASFAQDGLQVVAAGMANGAFDLYTIALDGSKTIGKLCTSNLPARVDFAGSVAIPPPGDGG